MSSDRSLPADFRPELISRRGEFTARGLMLVVLATTVLLGVRLGSPPLLALVFTLLLSLAAAGISLSNWMDRRTHLHLDASGIAFENGLRRVALPWAAVKTVQVLDSPLGDKVRVVGEQAHFSFRTLGEVVVGGELKGRMGFPEGDQILALLLQHSGLQAVETTASGRIYGRI